MIERENFVIQETLTFLMDEDFQIKSDLDISKLFKKKPSLEKPYSINRLKDVFRFPLLYLLGRLNLENTHFIEDYFETKDTQDLGHSLHVELRKSTRSEFYEVTIHLVKKSETLVEKIKNEANTDKSLQSIDNKLDDFITDTDSLRSIKKDLKAYESKVDFRINQIRKSKAELRMLIDSSPKSIILIDSFNSIIQYNEKAKELLYDLFGISIQKGLVFPSLLDPQDSSNFRKKSKLISEGSENLVSNIFEIHTQNGSKSSIQMEFASTGITNESLKTMSVTLTDVSDNIINKKVKEFSFEIMREALDPRKTIKEISDLFIEKYEDLQKNTFCSIMVVSDKHLKNLSSPSFPAYFFNNLERLNSRRMKKLVELMTQPKEFLYTEYLSSDSSWEYLKEPIEEFGIESCTQYPIVGVRGEPFALFNVFAKQNIRPNKKEIELTEHLLELMSLVFEMIRHKEKHESLLTSIQDGFISIDNEMKIYYWNDTAEKITGFNKDYAVNHDLWKVFKGLDQEDICKAQDIIKHHKRKSLTVFETILDKWIEFIFYPSESNKWSVFFRDVSNKQEREHYITETNERLENVMNAVNDAIYEFKVNEDIILWSNGYEDLFGYYNQDSITSSKERYDLIHQDDRKRIISVFNSALNDPNQNSWRTDYYYKRKNGTYAFVMDKGNILRDEDGKPESVIGVVADISYRKEYEKSLEVMNSSLKERALELKKSNEELEQFAYLASHDLQEPLRTITNFINRLEKKYGDQLDKNAYNYMHFIVDGATRMRSLITDLLKYSQLNKTPFNYEKVNINSLINSVTRSLQKDIKDSNATINYKDSPTIISGETQLFQIFSNLISNSIKYRKPDVAPIIHIDYINSDKNHIFTVSDNGMGIPIKFQQKIYDIFTRLHVSPEYSGTGIGLAIVKKSVEVLKGEIDLHSNKEGTVFRISIPKKVD